MYIVLFQICTISVGSGEWGQVVPLGVDQALLHLNLEDATRFVRNLNNMKQTLRWKHTTGITINYANMKGKAELHVIMWYKQTNVLNRRILNRTVSSGVLVDAVVVIRYLVTPSRLGNFTNSSGVASNRRATSLNPMPVWRAIWVGCRATLPCSRKQK